MLYNVLVCKCPIAISFVYDVATIPIGGVAGNIGNSRIGECQSDDYFATELPFSSLPRIMLAKLLS